MDVIGYPMLYYGVWQLLYVIFTEYIVNLDKDPSQHVRTCRPKRHSGCARIVPTLFAWCLVLCRLACDGL